MSSNRFDFNTSYKAIAVSQSDSLLGSAGKVGDLLERLIVSVATAATGTVSIKDGNGSAIPITAANTPIGVYTVQVGALCIATTTPGWRVTTGAGATVVAVGRWQ